VSVPATDRKEESRTALPTGFCEGSFDGSNEESEMVLAMAPVRGLAPDWMLESGSADGFCDRSEVECPAMVLRLFDDVSAVVSSKALVMASKRVSWLDQKSDSS